MLRHDTASPAAAPAGHAHHFLSRLDRVARAHVETALTLYRDEDLLRFILDRAALPADVERVAIALDDRARGPFLIVTRDARFVTCLAEGMRASNRFVISRAQLDGHMARAREMRERNEALLDLGARAKDVYRRVIDAADDFPREEMLAATAQTPLIRGRLVGLTAQVAAELDQIRATMVPILRRTQNPSRLTHPILRIYWKLAFATGHLSVLLGVDGPGLVELVPALVGEHGPLLSLLSVRQGIVAVAVKGIWAAGKVGRELLPAYKRAFAESRCQVQIADAALGLTMLGLRHARLRAEVCKALAPAHASAARDDGTRALAEALGEQGRAVLGDPGQALAAHRAYGATRLARMTSGLPAGSPWRFAQAADVPEDLAMTAGASLYQDFLADTRHLLGMFALLPWLSRARAADLYLPADLIRATRTPFRPADAIAMLGGHVARPPAPKRTEPSRSGPCPCGSGRKYKRCCEVERPAAALSKAA